MSRQHHFSTGTLRCFHCGKHRDNDPPQPCVELPTAARSAVERLADEWRDRPEMNEAAEAWVFADQLAAAIEADRAAEVRANGKTAMEWLRVAADLEAEIERLGESVVFHRGEAVKYAEIADNAKTEVEQMRAEVERIKDETPTVVIKQGLGQPTTCTVTYQGRTLFDGVSRDVLVEREAEVQRLRANTARLYERAHAAEATLAKVRALLDERGDQ